MAIYGRNSAQHWNFVHASINFNKHNTDHKAHNFLCSISRLPAFSFNFQASKNHSGIYYIKCEANGQRGGQEDNEINQFYLAYDH